jgi:F-type H+-transporting ATPase subunit gamma
MVTLREIRNKLHSVENVKKITQAMEMVAGARLRRVQARTENARPYLMELKLILNNLLASSDDLSHPLTTVRPVKRVGLVVIGADKGLCGSYNNNIIGAVNSFLKGKDYKEHEFFLIGHKMVAYFDKPENRVQRKVVDWGENITFELINSLTNELIGSFLDGKLDEVWLVYTHFLNVMTHKAVVEKLLPIEIPASTKEAASSNYIFEPSQQHIFSAILPRYCLSKLQLAMNEAFTSELAARILAMRAATKNADEMANDLTLVRNKLRQTGITRELIEITSGAEASKSLL